MTQLQESQDKSPARVGSLENPEIYSNLPGQVIPILQREFDDFDNEARKFLDGELTQAAFTGFRLRQGVYGQRQSNVQMIRVKLPFGGVTSDQLDALAQGADLALQRADVEEGQVLDRRIELVAVADPR